MIADTIARPTREVARANFIQQAEHLQLRAARGETGALRLGPIIFFCAKLDAWLLDPEDGVARCVMSQGEKLPLGIVDLGIQFGVKWNADCQLEGDQFLVRQFGGGTVCVMEGYPVREIAMLASGAAAN